MRAAQILLKATKSNNKSLLVPLEMYPLFAAMAVAIGSACTFTYRHFAYDQQLRLWNNPDLLALDKTLNEHKDE